MAELSDKKRRGASLCSYYGRSAGPGAAGGAAAPGGQQAPPEAAAVLGGTSFRSSPWELPPAAEEGTVSSPAAGGEGEPEEEEDGAEKRRGRRGGSHNGSGDWGAAPGCAKPRNFLYVGVMTAQKYLGSRAVAAQRTWAPSVPGRVEFFSSQGSAAPPGLPPLPVVALPGVDDSYPPQKKSFMMIKYMHDHYLDKYEWFMRADDDVYIKGDRGAPRRRRRRRRQGGRGALALGARRGATGGREGESVPARGRGERKGCLDPPRAPLAVCFQPPCAWGAVPALVGTPRCPRGAGPGHPRRVRGASEGRGGGLDRGGHGERSLRGRGIPLRRPAGRGSAVGRRRGSWGRAWAGERRGGAVPASRCARPGSLRVAVPPRPAALAQAAGG